MMGMGGGERAGGQRGDEHTNTNEEMDRQVEGGSQQAGEPIINAAG